MSQRKASRVEVWAARLSRWSRGVRMLIVAAIALVFAVFFLQFVTLLVGPAVQADASAATSLFGVSVVAGFVVYALGWWVLVGFSGDPHPPLGAGAVSFVLMGILVALMLLAWALISTLIAALPPEVPI